ncbi:MULTISPECIES: hypothetical protein [Pseudomonas]|jgi:hypothetical protein|uniref:Flagellar protein FlhE n=1 Tax=Pseudomonas mosselii TaxID=78327 RepID=A0A5R8YUW6_9PSED|nr:hypothetical protein [Pseudomonas mosselii]TLP57308.1 hypothetical protein FEM01_17000 [Pseudomonas mosselii]
MKKIVKLTTWAAAVLLAQASLAATTDSWTSNKLAPNVVIAQTENSNFYTTPISVPKGALITTVSWDVGLYDNGAAGQFFTVCYARRYTTSYDICYDLTNMRVGSTTLFKGLDAKGQFKITGVLSGGTYPVYPRHRNTITVEYQY